MYIRHYFLRLARIGIFALSMIALTAQAVVPNTLNYQGQLSSLAGVPVNATVSITFKLYATANGGTALWSETQSIQIVNGQYSATLGSVVSLSQALFSNSLYLGLSAGTDAEMIPRIALNTAPYAMYANKSGDASTLSGFTAAQLQTGFAWVDVTGTTQQAVSNSGYLADNAALVTITLPATPAIGDIIKVTGIGAGGWKIVTNAGQFVISKNNGGTPAQTATISGLQYDAIELQYIGNSLFVMLNNVSNQVTSPVAVAPTASSVSISGTAQVGQILTGNYTYLDANGDTQGVSTFRWLRSGVAITGATATTYTLVSADQGSTITFEVTPVSTIAPTTGTPVVSAATAAVVAASTVATVPVASNVSISGTTTAGSTLTGNYTYFDANGDPQGVSTFRWFSNGTVIAGATASTYNLATNDQGKTVIFEVTPVSTVAPTTGVPVLSAATAAVTAGNLPAGYVLQGGLLWTPATFTKVWADANTYCTGSILNGTTGWRLPTVAELSALYASGAMNGQGWTLSYTWSSMPNGSGIHYYVGLDNGGVYSSYDTNSYYVSCVH